MDRANLLARAEQIAAYYGGGKQIKSDVDSWLTICPAHADEGPSLHVTVTDKILIKCHAGCTQTDVIKHLKADGMWVQSKPKEETVKEKPRSKINIPAHRIPDLDQILIGRERPTKIYPYVTEEGEPAFWVLRLDRPGKAKVVRPYSSVHYDDGDKFEMALNCTVRPLYRLNVLVNNPDKPVMVVEGEKACEAAEQIFSDYVVVTWSGGAGGVKKSVWSVLKDRDVTLWPDNDGPGIKSMMEIAAQINAANPSNIPKIVFTAPIEDLPEGWDLADEYDADVHSPESLLVKAELVNLDKIKGVAAQSIGSAEWIKKFSAKYVRVLEGGSLNFYNVTSSSAQMEGTIPFVWLNSVKTLREVESAKVYDLIEQKQKYAIDYWLEDQTQPTAYGLIYDPTTSDKLVNIDSNVFLNTFPGFAHEPTQCDMSKISPFINHIREVLGEVESGFLLDYIAHMVQKPHQKPGVMIILTGKPGAGKTIICDIIAAMLGRQNAIIVDSAAFTQSNFNGLFSSKIFVTINELNVASRRDHTLSGKIKAWVTDEHYTVNAKFKAQRTEKSYHRFIATTNSDIPFPVDTNDRRIAVFDVDGKYRNDVKHFLPLLDIKKDHEALAGLMHYFMNYEIKNSVTRPPQTVAVSLAFHAEDPVVEWLYDVLSTGMFPTGIREQVDKTNDWVRYGVVIPRSLVVESILAHHRNITKNYVTSKLVKHIPRKTCSPGHENNQIRMEIYDKMARTYTSIKDRVFEFMPLEQQRQTFCEVTGHQVIWPEVTDDEPDKKDNVVQLKASEVL